MSMAADLTLCSLLYCAYAVQESDDIGCSDFLYGTMFLPLWLRLLGCDIPFNAECAAHLNTLTFIPELVSAAFSPSQSSLYVL